MREVRSYRSFAKQLHAGQIGSGYIFVGREAYLLDEVLAAMRDALLTDDFADFDGLPREGDAWLVDEFLHQMLSAPGSGVGNRQLVLAETEEQLTRLADARRTVESFDYASYQGRETDVDQVLMGIRTAPFVARRRLVVVKQFDAYRKDGVPRLLEELSRETPTCRLVLTAEAGDPALARAVAAQGCGRFVVELPDSTADDLNRLIDGWAGQHRLKVTDDARQLLTEMCGDSLTQLRSELDKIRTALGARATVTKDAVRDLAGHWREYEVSEFVDAFTERNRILALSNLRRLNDWNEEPVKIVVWLAGRLMRMLAGGGGRLWSKPELANSLRHLSAIDLKLKRGFPERYYLLENFVIRRAVARTR